MKKSDINSIIRKTNNKIAYDCFLEIERKNKKYTNYSIVLIIVVLISSISVVYASEIKNTIISWYAAIKLDDGSEINISKENLFKKIPNSAQKLSNWENSIEMTHEQLENTLGFKILNYDNTTSDKMYYRTTINGDDISRIDVWWPLFIYKDDNNFITMSIGILSENAYQGDVEAFKEGYDSSFNKKIEKEYISNNLNSNVVIYSSIRDSKYICAQFVYDNVLYYLSGKNISISKMEEIIENLV